MRRARVLATTCALLTVAAAFAAPSAHAATFTVNLTDDSHEADPGDGVCNAVGSKPPGCSIRAAIEEANAFAGRDRINVPANLYELISGLPLTVSSDVSIVGASARTVGIRMAGNFETGVPFDRVFDITSTALVTLRGLTILNGRADGRNNHFGGDIRNAGQLSLVEVTVADGVANSGGGLANVGGTVTIRDSTFTNNRAPADTGAGGDAGAILNFGEPTNPASLTIETSTISTNIARLTGGIFSYNNAGNTVVIKNSTIALNQSGTRGGGGGLGVGAGTATLENTIVSNNSSPSDPLHPNCSGAITSLGHNLEHAFDCGFTATGDVQGEDPALGKLGNYGGETDTHSLGPRSPALDRANNAVCLAADQRGFFRPQGGVCDIGAFELDQPPNTSITSGPSGLTNDSTPSFDFASSEPGGTFRCRIDSAALAPCTSPFTPAAALADGPHTFTVEATDLAGNVDPSPASRAFTVDTAPPETTIDSGPPALTTDSTPTFTFSSDDPGATFECSLDSGPFASCASPFTTPSLGSGSHTFVVRAIDPSGNVDPSPALGFDTAAAMKEFTLLGAAEGPPVFAASFNVEAVSGDIFVSVPVPPTGAQARIARAQASQAPPGYESPIKGRVFVPLEEVRQLPVGSFVDTRFGTVRLESARNRKGRTQAGRFAAGVFQVLQSRRRAKGITDLQLKGGAFRGCRARSADGSAVAAGLSRRTIRRLRSSARGRFRTGGRNSSATVRGTIWEVVDRCDGTLTKVRRGKVAVRDFRLKRTVLVRAGKSYLARARR